MISFEMSKPTSHTGTIIPESIVQSGAHNIIFSIKIEGKDNPQTLKYLRYSPTEYRLAKEKIEEFSKNGTSCLLTCYNDGGPHPFCTNIVAAIPSL